MDSTNRWLAGLSATFAALVAVAAPVPAHPADGPSPWSLRVGAGRASFGESAQLQLAGRDVPGAAVEVGEENLLIGDLGRDVGEHWRVRMAFGLPVRATVTASGTLRSYVPPLSGTLGEVSIAPLLATALFAPGQYRGFTPYLGAGAAWVLVTETADRDVASLEATGGFAPVLQGGVDWAISRRWFAYADARWLAFATEISGSVPALGGAPVAGEVRLDPLVVSVGVGRRF